MMRTDIAVVIIGRNEAPRIADALRSAGGRRTVYVDSGSTDGSPDRVRAAAVELIELDPDDGYSAARARNAGLERMISEPAITYVQMLDGDCTLHPEWIGRGTAALDADPGLGAVFGRLREKDPDSSIFAWLCDREWAVTPGPALFGGNVLLRAAAVRATGGYRSAMIAGEDPEYAIRLRQAGWRVLCLAEPMGRHDAAITRFGQWWRRAVRAGHAFAAITTLHPRPAPHDFARNVTRILFWAGALPLVAIGGLTLSLLHDPRWLLLPALALLLTATQMLRVTVREARSHGLRRGAAYALFMAIGKYAEMIGLVRFHLERLRGSRPA